MFRHNLTKVTNNIIRSLPTSLSPRLHWLCSSGKFFHVVALKLTSPQPRNSRATSMCWRWLVPRHGRILDPPLWTRYRTWWLASLPSYGHRQSRKVGSIYLICMDRQSRYGAFQEKTTTKTNRQTNKTVKKKGRAVGKLILGNNEQMFSKKGDKMEAGKETKSIFFLSVSH